MEGIILLNFEEKDREYFETENIKTFLFQTNELNELPTSWPEAEVIFFQMDKPAEENVLPFDLSPKIQEMVKAGTRAVCFIGKGRLYQLSSIIGTYPEIHFQDAMPGDNIQVTPQLPFNLLFDKYYDRISHMYKLLPNSFGLDQWEIPSVQEESWKIVAKSSDGYPVSIIIKKGKGLIWLLPSFGENNFKVADFILKDIFPLLELKEEKEEQTNWIEKEEYLFPEIKKLYLQKEEEKRRYEEKIREIDEQIRQLKNTEQEMFYRLLKAEGRELKEAVIYAFNYLGWGKVIDVDAYWKNVIRDKEEDIWLIESADQPTEVSLRMDFLILVIVRSSKNWASDDDCVLLQRYKGRRMQEFDNTKMKAILVGNYFNQQEAKLRENPFSQFQIEEAEKDKNLLLTTYDLFKAIKAEKEGLISKEEINRQLKEKSGLLQFNF
ncbi:MAG: hypothetical protein H5U07_06325 [Candidatus Aminicenantes bacterium]|nr:hypothetical protein [Candidatus Aminicenantes bacterium]